MSRIALVRTTFGDTSRAEQVARSVIGERLAACATLDQVRSIYRWHGEIEQADEVAVLFKTSIEHAPALRARVAELHDYHVPVIEHWAAETDASAADWVRVSTAG
jgi:periplasmic divalent cation tolerance protein